MLISFGSDCSGIEQVQASLSSFNSTGQGQMGDDDAIISPKFDTGSSYNYPASPDLTTFKSSDTSTGDMLSGICLSPNSDGSGKHLLMDPWNLDEGWFGFDD